MGGNDDPNFRTVGNGDRYAGSTVESINGIFEVVQLTGGRSNNTIVVNDSDNTIYIGGVARRVTPFKGKRRARQPRQRQPAERADAVPRALRDHGQHRQQRADPDRRHGRRLRRRRPRHLRDEPGRQHRAERRGRGRLPGRLHPRERRLEHADQLPGPRAGRGLHARRLRQRARRRHRHGHRDRHGRRRRPPHRRHRAARPGPGQPHARVPGRRPGRGHRST